LPIDIEVRDIAGRLIHTYAFVPNGNAANWVLNTSSFEAGMYQVVGIQGLESAHTTIVVR